MAMSFLSQAIKETVNELTRQNGSILSRLAGYLRSLSTFIMNSQDLMISKTVSYQTRQKYDIL